MKKVFECILQGNRRNCSPSVSANFGHVVKQQKSLYFYYTFRFRENGQFVLFTSLPHLHLIFRQLKSNKALKIYNQIKLKEGIYDTGGLFYVDN